MACSYCEHQTSQSRPGIFRTVLQLALVYLMVVFTGGTLMNTGHPVANEVGQIIQLVTFIDPLIGWASGSGFESLATGLNYVAGGLPVDEVLS